MDACDQFLYAMLTFAMGAIGVIVKIAVDAGKKDATRFPRFMAISGVVAILLLLGFGWRASEAKCPALLANAWASIRASSQIPFGNTGQTTSTGEEQTNSTQQPQSLPEEVYAAILRMDEVHHQTDFTLNPASLPEAYTGQKLAEQIRDLARLESEGCYWNFDDLMEPQVISWEHRDDKYFVRVEKRWRHMFYCRGTRIDEESGESRFRVTYELWYDNGWKVAETSDSNVLEFIPVNR